MAILRAGPWGNLNNTHEDVPSDTSVGLNIYPVNCALSDWPNQDWAAYFISYDSLGSGSEPSSLYGVSDLGESVSRSSNSSLDLFTPVVEFYFCYQATESFDIDFNWEFTGTNNNFPSLSWSYATIEGDVDSYFNTPASSGTEVISLPATSFGKVICSVEGYLSLSGQGELTVTASLS